MAESIKDGTGKAFLAKVTNKNLLAVKAEVDQRLAVASLEDGKGWSVGTSVLPVTATGGHMLWFKHENTDQDFVIHQLLVSWNGGDTNHNRALTGNIFYGTPEPTGNHLAISPLNLNRGSVAQSGMTVYMWNTVTGDGLTVASDGTAGGSAIGSQGMTTVNLEGSLVIPPNVAVSIKVGPEEAGKCSLIVLGGFHDRE